MRTTIQIDDEVFDRVRRLVPTRGLSRFVNEALVARVDQLERERMQPRCGRGTSPRAPTETN